MYGIINHFNNELQECFHDAYSFLLCLHVLLFDSCVFTQLKEIAWRIMKPVV